MTEFEQRISLRRDFRFCRAMQTRPFRGFRAEFFDGFAEFFVFQTAVFVESGVGARNRDLVWQNPGVKLARDGSQVRKRVDGADLSCRDAQKRDDFAVVFGK